jgi:hypothetical protein
MQICIPVQERVQMEKHQVQLKAGGRTKVVKFYHGTEVPQYAIVIT